MYVTKQPNNHYEIALGLFGPVSVEILLFAAIYRCIYALQEMAS